jgi:hypothetical protein
VDRTQWQCRVVDGRGRYDCKRFPFQLLYAECIIDGVTVRRKLYAFAVVAEEQWATQNQLQSNLLGGLLMLVVILKVTTPVGLGGMAGAIVFSAFGGLLVPVAKDLVSALQKVGER